MWDPKEELVSNVRSKLSILVLHLAIHDLFIAHTGTISLENKSFAYRDPHLSY